MTTDKTNNDCIYEKIERYYIDNYEGQNDDGKYRGKPGRAIIKEAIEKYQPSAPAVKGVDELIKKRKHNHIDCGQERGILIEDFIADLKTLKQTPVAKEDVCEMGKHIMLQPGEYYKDEFGNIITYEDE